MYDPNPQSGEQEENDQACALGINPPFNAQDSRIGFGKQCIFRLHFAIII
jgi:hypothetical protein